MNIIDRKLIISKKMNSNKYDTNNSEKFDKSSNINFKICLKFQRRFKVAKWSMFQR